MTAKTLLLAGDYSYFSTYRNPILRATLKTHSALAASWLKTKSGSLKREGTEVVSLFSPLSGQADSTHTYQDIVLAVREEAWWKYRSDIYEGLEWLSGELARAPDPALKELFDGGWNWLVYQLYEGFYLGWIVLQECLSKEKPARLIGASGWAQANGDLLDFACRSRGIERPPDFSLGKHLPLGPAWWHKKYRALEARNSFEQLEEERLIAARLPLPDPQATLPLWFLGGGTQVQAYREAVLELKAKTGKTPLVLRFFPTGLLDTPKFEGDFVVHPLWSALTEQRYKEALEEGVKKGAQLWSWYSSLARDGVRTETSLGRRLVLSRGAGRVFHDFFTWCVPQIHLTYTACGAWREHLGQAPRRVACARPVRVAEGGLLYWGRKNGATTTVVNYSEAPDRWLHITYKDAHEVGVMGPYAGNYCVKMGAPRSGIKPMGDPRYDGLWTRGLENVEKSVRSSLGLGPTQAVACVLSTKISHIRSWEHLKAFHEIIHGALARRSQDVLELVKLHPKQKRDLTEQHFRRWGVWPVAITQDIDVKDLLTACRFAIMNLSQAGWETLCIGKPLIVLDHYHNPDTLAGSTHMFPFLKDGTALIVRSAGELSALVDRLLDDDGFYNAQLEKIKKFQEGNFYGRGEPVKRRVVEILTQSSKGDLQ